MLGNRRFARLLFTCLDCLRIMTSLCFLVAKTYLYHRLLINESQTIYLSRGNIDWSIFFFRPAYFTIIGYLII